MKSMDFKISLQEVTNKGLVSLRLAQLSSRVTRLKYCLPHLEWRASAPGVPS